MAAVKNISIRIPIFYRGAQDAVATHVVFYPDEIPEDSQILLDVLKAALAPLKVWNICALEYHRQGLDEQFDSVLTEIINALKGPDIEKIYRDAEKDLYDEGLYDIFIALASKYLNKLRKIKQTVVNVDKSEYNSTKVVEYLKLADEKSRMNEYTWLVKGFFEIVHGDVKRAEDQFRIVFDRTTKGQNSGSKKKRYLFGALVGMGLIMFCNQKYDVALEHFIKAVHINHIASGHGVRFAVACSLYKLQQYDRSKLALEKCLSVDSTDPKTFVLLALIELVYAKRDRNKRLEHRARAYDYSILANALNPNDAQALILLANHKFHSWSVINLESGCFMIDASHLLVPIEAVRGCLGLTNQMKIHIRKDANKPTDGDSSAITYTIVSAFGHENFLEAFIKQLQMAVSGTSTTINLLDFIVIQVSPSVPERYLDFKSTISFTPVSCLEVKDLTFVKQCAQQAIISTSSQAIIAEGNYILGKVAHMSGDAAGAFDFYWKALKDAPDMAPAAFGAAQLLMARNELHASLELFDKVLSKNPDDKDTQGFVMLLKAITKGVVAPLDRLREIAPGFQYEIDLWLIQGKLRQKDPLEHKNALKCFINAKEIIEARLDAQGLPLGLKAVPPEVLSNISALHHSLGKLDKALQFCKDALISFKTSDDDDDVHRSDDAVPALRNSELEGIFYSWADSVSCRVAVADAGRFVITTADDSDSQLLDFNKIVSVGDEILISDVKHQVRSVVSASEIICYSPVKLELTSVHDLKLKVSFNNFTDETMTYIFNLARLFEDRKQTTAAIELYIELLKKHPCYIECYLRLSLISSDMGKLEEASMWLSRALAVNDSASDATLCLGDLHQRSAQFEDAKKCYDKICQQNHHDSRAMLSLGNFYFALSSAAKSDSQLKDSYKFFYHVLNENHSNAYAANGLGMVCVEKREIEAAREIFSKAREANVPMSEDICTNLAHVYLLQNRLVDAERLYQATIKSLSQTGSTSSDSLVSINEYVSYAQFSNSRHEEAIKSLLIAAHLNPTNLRLWYNIAFVGEAYCTNLIEKSMADFNTADGAGQILAMSKKLFKALALPQSQTSQKVYDRKLASIHSASCVDKRTKLDKLVAKAKAEADRQEADRVAQEVDHLARMKMKAEMQQHQEQMLVAGKLQKQLQAEQTMNKLKELQAKWHESKVTTGMSQSRGVKAAAANSGGNKKRRRPGNETNDHSDDDDDDDAESVVQKSKKQIKGNDEFKGDIDFGTSDESDADKYRISNNPKTRSANDDLFGGDSDDETPFKGGDGDNDAETDSKKTRLIKSTAVMDDDEEEEFAMETNTDVAMSGIDEAVTVKARKQRVINDDSD